MINTCIRNVKFFADINFDKKKNYKAFNIFSFLLKICELAPPPSPFFPLPLSIEKHTKRKINDVDLNLKSYRNLNSHTLI